MAKRKSYSESADFSPEGHMARANQSLRNARAALKQGDCVMAQVAGTFALSNAEAAFVKSVGTSSRNKMASLARRAGAFLRDDMVSGGCVRKAK